MEDLTQFYMLFGAIEWVGAIALFSVAIVSGHRYFAIIAWSLLGFGAILWALLMVAAFVWPNFVVTYRPLIWFMFLGVVMPMFVGTWAVYVASRKPEARA